VSPRLTSPRLVIGHKPWLPRELRIIRALDNPELLEEFLAQNCARCPVKSIHTLVRRRCDNELNFPFWEGSSPKPLRGAVALEHVSLMLDPTPAFAGKDDCVFGPAHHVHEFDRLVTQLLYHCEHCQRVGWAVCDFEKGGCVILWLSNQILGSTL
jgi:hypothetical protein